MRGRQRSPPNPPPPPLPPFLFSSVTPKLKKKSGNSVEQKFQRVMQAPLLIEVWQICDFGVLEYVAEPTSADCDAAYRYTHLGGLRIVAFAIEGGTI